MVKKIIWTKEALDNKLKILNYWNQRNKSKVYSKKLNKLFKDSTKVIQRFPSLGRPSSLKDYKNIQAKEYLIFYRETEESIYILQVWDGRQDPQTKKY
jgi:toxin YoeB